MLKCIVIVKNVRKSILLFFFFSFLSTSYAQDTSSGIIDTSAFIIDTLKIFPVDSSKIIPLSYEDSIKKAERKEKTQKMFRVFSYLKYKDSEVLRQFTGVERYKPYKGKKIGSIQVRILKPYGEVEDDYSLSMKKKAQKFGNKIHFSSKEKYVWADILFKEGDKVDPVLFADTEKLLWDRKKFKDVQIILEESETPGEVDVLVYVQDKLSWVVGLGYNDRLSMGIATYNFFGLPNTLAVYAGVNFNKYNLWAVGGSYKYENIKSSQVNFISSFVVEKLNKNAQFNLYRNFFSIKTQWAFDASYAYDYSTLSLTYKPRDTFSFVRTRFNTYSLWLAYGLPFNKIVSVQDDKLKLVFAIKFDNIRYRLRPFLTYTYYDKIFVNQQNYRFGIGVARWDYYLARNAFYLEMGEFFPRGYSASLWMGPQIDEVYGKRTSFDITVNYGIHVHKGGYFYPQVNYSGYIRKKKGEEMVTTISLDYVSDRANISKRVFFRQVIKGSTRLGAAVPEGRYFSINEENGIRGFYSPVIKGSKSFVLSAESDLYFDKKIALTKAMLYIFCDMAWISQNQKTMFKESSYQYGVGLGIRLRSVDLGVPHLDLQFSIYPKGKDFGQNLLRFSAYGSNPNAIQQNNMFAEPSFEKSYNAKLK